jgi:hypothetical protein
MRKLLTVCLVLVLGTPAYAAIGTLGPVPVAAPVPLSVLPNVNSTGGSANVQCEFNYAVNITTTGAKFTQVVAASGTKVVYICGYSLQTLSGTAPTFKFASGTHTTTGCDTSELDLSGVFGSSTGQMFTWPSTGYPAFASPAGQTLCLYVNGAAATVTGFIKYTIF